MEPSLSSTSAMNSASPPTSALAKGCPGPAKSFMSAPFITVGSSPARRQMSAIIPVVVDLPEVPATPTERGAALNRRASSSGRVTMDAPTRRAATTSGMVPSTAAEVTRI